MAGGNSRVEHRQPGVHLRDNQARSAALFADDSDDNSPSTLLRNPNWNGCWRRDRRHPEMERTVLGLYYTEELTLREIAQVVNLHESRISQLKSQAILRLRSHLAGAVADRQRSDAV
jgi:RNA polymerase sigma factor FliA